MKNFKSGLKNCATVAAIFFLFSTLSNVSRAQDNYSFLFDSVETYIIADTLDSIPSRDLTIECWYKMQSDSSNQALFDFGKDADNFFLYNLNSRSTGAPILTISIDGWKFYSSPFVNSPKGIWTHLAISLEFTDSTTSVDFYSNGNIVGHDSINYDLSLNGSFINNYLGRSRGSLIFRDGIIDEFRIWKKALSAKEVADNYTKSLSELSDTFLVYYDFNNVNADTVYDISTYSKKGIIYNNTANTNLLADWGIANNNIFYVAEGGSGDGSSWGNEMGSIQQAIDSCTKYGGEIWVKEGTYYPTVQYDGNTDDSRKNAFVLKNNVNIYGGFSGVESAKDERVPNQNISILSGNIGDPQSNNDNCYHVVFSYKIVPSYGFNNFKITDGNANSESGIDRYGGGAYLEGGYFKDCMIKNNDANNNGGGVYISRVGIIDNCELDSNFSSSNGGGVYMENGYAAILQNSLLTTNKASGSGGAVFINGEGIIRNSKIYNNASYYGGGVYSSSGGVINNTLFANNKAIWGGGANLRSTHIKNSTFVGNYASNGGGAMLDKGSIYNSIFWNNTASDFKNQLYNILLAGEVLYCAIQNSEYSDVTNISLKLNTDSVPNFVNEVSFVSNATNETELQEILNSDYRVNLNSICVDRGSNEYIPDFDFDLNGLNRISNVTVDIGAYEATFATVFIVDSVLNYNESIQQPSDIQTIPASVNFNITDITTLDGISANPENAGKYIMEFEISDSKYLGSNTDTFRIQKAEQVITFDSIPLQGINNYTVDLQIVSNTDNPILLELSNDTVANFIGATTLEILDSGLVIITASQAETENYKESTPVIRYLKVEYEELQPIVELYDTIFTYNGDSQVPYLLVTPASLNYSIQQITNLNQQVTEPLNAGEYIVEVLVDDPRYVGSFSDTFTIAKAEQVISFNDIPVAQLTDKEIILTATSNSANPILFNINISNTDLANYIGNFTVELLDSGTVTITASQEESVNYLAAISVDKTLKIEYNRTTPVLVFDQADFIYDGLSHTPDITITPDTVGYAITAITDLSLNVVEPINAGEYIINASVDDFYYYGEYTDTFQILKADQFITFDTIYPKLNTDADFALVASASSGLPVSFASSDESVARIINGNIVEILGIGNITITASQTGNNNYNAADDYIRSLLISLYTDFNGFVNSNELKVFPNPVRQGTFLNIEIEGYHVEFIELSDFNGKIVMNKRLNSNTVLLPDCKTGVYNLRIVTSDKTFNTKVFVK